MKEIDESSVLSAFRSHIETMVPVSDPLWSLLIKAMKVATLKKGDLVLEEGPSVSISILFTKVLFASCT